MAGASHAETSFWHKPAGAVRSCCNNEFPARSIAEMVATFFSLKSLSSEMYSSLRIQNHFCYIRNVFQDVWACWQVHCLQTITLCGFNNLSQLGRQLPFRPAPSYPTWWLPAFSHLFKFYTNIDIYWNFYKNHIGTPAWN